MSYTRLVYHVIFRTKSGQQAIPEQFERDLYAYILGFVRNKKSKLYRIGGMPDHIHLLVEIHQTIAISDFMRQLKESSSKWLKSNPNFPYFTGWGDGYAAFTYNKNDIPTVMEYIKSQKTHHKIFTFAEEYRKFLVENGVEIEECYFLKN